MISYGGDMMPRKESVLREKSEKFTTRIIKLYQYLNETKHERTISNQIYRSGTSIGANIAESRNAQSTPDYISKLSIALKEAEETKYWINNLYVGGYMNEKEYNSIFNDSIEIIKILTSSIKKVKSKAGIL